MTSFPAFLFFFYRSHFDPLSDRISLRSSLLWVGSDFTQTFPVFSRKFSLLSCRAKRERESFSKHHLPRDIVISLLRRLIFLVQVVVTGHEVKLKIIKKYRCIGGLLKGSMSFADVCCFFLCHVGSIMATKNSLFFFFLFKYSGAMDNCESFDVQG